MDHIQIHASGHANREDLIQIINKIKPKTVIPIHTDNPREFKKLLQSEGYQVITPEEGNLLHLR